MLHRATMKKAAGDNFRAPGAVGRAVSGQRRRASVHAGLRGGMLGRIVDCDEQRRNFDAIGGRHALASRCNGERLSLALRGASGAFRAVCAGGRSWRLIGTLPTKLSSRCAGVWRILPSRLAAKIGSSRRRLVTSWQRRVGPITRSLLGKLTTAKSFDLSASFRLTAHPPAFERGKFQGAPSLIGCEQPCWA
jgi:hypothetical protein